MTHCVVVGGGAFGQYVVERLRSLPQIRFVGTRETSRWLREEIPEASQLRSVSLGGLRQILRAEGAGSVTFAGNIFSQFPSRLDALTFAYCARQWSFLQPQGLIRATEALLKDEGVLLVGVLELIPEIGVERSGLLGGASNGYDPQADFASVMHELGAKKWREIRQGYIVDGGKVLMNDACGTEELLSRFGASEHRTTAKHPALVRVSRWPYGNFDPPVIGEQTIISCAENGIKEILIETGGTVFLDRAKALAQARIASIGVHALWQKVLDNASNAQGLEA